MPVERITHAIVLCRRQKVLLDRDLAALYGVETKALNQAVRRNRGRFPADFMFQLNAREISILRSQSVTSSGHGGRRTPPYAFTEQGVAMLSSVLHSPRAIVVNIEIMRAFVRLRRVLQSHAHLARRLTALEARYDGLFASVFRTLQPLRAPDSVPARRIGFQAPGVAPAHEAAAPAERGASAPGRPPVGAALVRRTRGRRNARG